MMMLKTDRNDEFEIKYALPKNGGAQIAVTLSGGVTLAEAAAALDGCETLTTSNTDVPGVVTLYTGYSVLTGVLRLSDGTLRVTLEKPAEV